MERINFSKEFKKRLTTTFIIHCFLFSLRKILELNYRLYFFTKIVAKTLNEIINKTVSISTYKKYALKLIY
jgi:hypothetical protein